jgi:molecular chaperone DnaK
MLIGVDLGLTNARAAWVDATGKTVLLETLTGRRVMPAAVGLDTSGQLHVGESARNQHLLDPEQATLRLRRLLGTSQRVMLGDKSFSPHELVAVVLSQLKEFSEQRLGCGVTGLALAVPCDFTATQSQAAIDAARLAGFRAVQLVLEPVAIAAAYGLRPSDLSVEQPILVCDLGARSCEAAVLVRDERGLGFAVRASAGNTIGSEECDQRVIGHLSHLYEREFGLSPHGSRKAMARLRLAAEWTKRALSTQESTTVRLPGLLTVAHTPFDLIAELSREQLELLIEDDLRRSLQAVEIALREARFLPSQLHAVLISGGGAEMPMFAKLLEDLVVTRPRQDVKPEEAIARGAALLGATRLKEGAFLTHGSPAPDPPAPNLAGPPADADVAPEKASKAQDANANEGSKATATKPDEPPTSPTSPTSKILTSQESKLPSG